jgi:hypothetical protein
MVWKKKETLKGLAKSSAVGKLFQDGHYLEITHVPTGYTVRFAAFLDGLSDAFQSEWRSEQVYGRMDPITTFANTRRALSVAWKIPAESPIHAKENLDEVSKLLSFLYPLYQEGVGTVINMGPLMRVKFGNLIHDAETGEGLLGYINGFTMDPEMEEGFFMFDSSSIVTAAERAAGVGISGGTEYYPKAIRLNFEMVVIHEHPLGWVKKASNAGDKASSIYYFRGGKAGFPYGSNDGPPVNPENPPVLKTGAPTQGQEQRRAGQEEAQQEQKKQRENAAKPGDARNTKANKALQPQRGKKR